MKTNKYTVELSCIYNGTVVIHAVSGEEALKIAQEMLNCETLKPFPDEVAIPNGKFVFGEATADNAYLEEE